MDTREMKTELRAAAERLLSNRECDAWQDFTDALEPWFVAAVRLLAENVVAKHPADDGVPIDEEFLWSLGYSDSALGREMKRFELCGDSVRVLARATHGPKCWNWSVWVGKKKMFDDPTRGQLRRLIAALKGT